MHVLVAIEPRSYREAIGQALQVLRPHVEVTVVDPEQLRATVARLDPELVFAGRPGLLPLAGRAAWVEFRPYEDPPARICLAGRRWEMEEVELDDLLSLVDRTEELARTTREPGKC